LELALILFAACIQNAQENNVHVSADTSLFSTVMACAGNLSEMCTVLISLHLLAASSLTTPSHLPASAVLQSRVNPKTQTPVFSVVFCGLLSAVLALFVPIGELADLTSLGALFAFCVVSLAVMFRCASSTDMYVEKNPNCILLCSLASVSNHAARS
jgi:amino acid transporter